MVEHKIDIMIATKDRHSELALLLQSLRSSKFQNFNLFILDDQSGTPFTQANFVVSLLNRMKLEGHKVRLLRNEISQGCCKARNDLIEAVVQEGDGDLCLRLDDDVVIEPDYLDKLIEVIDAGYDLASGVIPLVAQPELKRSTTHLKAIINEHKFDDKGVLIENNDECAYCYLEDKILPTHQFRTNALYKRELHDKIKYPMNLTTVAFREEGFFSFRAILAGYKLGVHTGAIAYHFQTPSGGNRRADYNQCVQIDEQTWRAWLKEKFDEHGDFLAKYNEEVKNENN